MHYAELVRIRSLCHTAGGVSGSVNLSDLRACQTVHQTQTCRFTKVAKLNLLFSGRLTSGQVKYGYFPLSGVIHNFESTQS